MQSRQGKNHLLYIPPPLTIIDAITYLCTLATQTQDPINSLYVIPIIVMILQSRCKLGMLH